MITIDKMDDLISIPRSEYEQLVMCRTAIIYGQELFNANSYFGSTEEKLMKSYFRLALGQKEEAKNADDEE